MRFRTALPSFKMNLAVRVTAICLLFTTGVLAADFDGDGIADELTIIRDAAKAAKEVRVVVVNPWQQAASSSRPKGLGFVIRLSRTGQRYLLHDSEYLSTPMWEEQKARVETVGRNDPRYREWKKEVSALKGDAIQLDTEAGINILLYWDGKRWRVFWPDEEP